jgi:hypothetical protein
MNVPPLTYLLSRLFTHFTCLSRTGLDEFPHRNRPEITNLHDASESCQESWRACKNDTIR